METKENPFQDFEVVSEYSRASALEDGVLVDISALAREAGFKIPVCITSGVHELCDPKDIPCQDYTGRLWDVLWLASLTVRRMIRENVERDTFNVLFQQKVGRRKVLLVVAFNSVEGFTIMLPEED